jgi:hypothetical protein
VQGGQTKKQNMNKVYEFIYYSLYKFCLNIGRKDIPERKAVVLLSLWEFLYLMIPFGLLRFFTGKDLRIPKPFLVAAFIAVCLIHFYHLVYKKGCLRIYRNFEKDIEFRKRYGIIIPLLFILTPILAMVLFTFTIWN